MLKNTLASIVIMFTIGAFLGVLPVAAQGFGSDPNNYYCPDKYGEAVLIDENAFKCTYRLDINGQPANFFERNAILKPPPLKIAQIWFVRVIYILWGMAGVVFTFLLIAIGVQYMLSFGNDKAIGDVIRKFQRWLLGLALIFLSYPILSTVFNLLPLSRSACYADVDIPGFQFFFPEACVRSCADQCQGALAGGSFAYQQCINSCEASAGN